MNKFIVVLAILIFALISCDNNEVSVNKMYIKEKIDYQFGYKETFEYDNEKLKSFKIFLHDELSIHTIFRYQDGLLVEIESEHKYGLDYITKLEYNAQGNRIKETTVSTQFENFPLDQYLITEVREFSYNEAGQLASIKSNFSDSTFLPMITEFEWQNDNLIKSCYSSLGSSRFSCRTYNYDRSKNYANQNLAFVYKTFHRREYDLSKNNITKATDLSNDQMLIDRGSYEYTYKNDYPISYIYRVNDFESDPTEIKY